MQGILLVNKEFNKTSRDMVNELNHIFGMKKIGHTGTLDPIATGVLVMCLGKYTKLVDTLSSMTKEYVAQIKLGIKTDTLDITGNVIEQKSRKVTKEEVLKALSENIGKFSQEVPIYSAKKINGKKLYEYARNAQEVKLPRTDIEIYELELLDMHDDIITFRALVSKGTYIRSLINDICTCLNTVGTMQSLVRTKQGKFDINDSFTIESVKEGDYKILLAKDVLDYPVYNLNDQEYHRVKNGNFIKLNENALHIILMYEGNEVAIYEKHEEAYKVSVMLI